MEQGERFPFSSVQSLYVVQLKQSLRRRLAHYTHVRRMRICFVENSIAHLSFDSTNSKLWSVSTYKYINIRIYARICLVIRHQIWPANGVSAPHRPYKKPGLGWPGRPGGARPNAQCSVDCSQLGIDRSPRAPDYVLSSSSILSIRLPNLRAIG